MNLIHAVLPVFIAFACELILCPLLIPVLKKLKFGQYIREDGPKHQQKAGTPQMGGIMIVLSFLAGTLGAASEYASFWIVPVMTVLFGAIGLLDDCIKHIMKHNEGLKAWQKFGLQILAGIVFAVYLAATGHSTDVPFHLFSATWHLGWFYYVFVVLACVAVANGTNFTDGLDGLCSSVTSVIAAFYMIVCLAAGTKLEGMPAAMLGSLLGFLMFNAYPAKVFMGDTGSLALGGFVVSIAFLLDMPMMILIYGFVYVAEVVSVMLQVAYFKATHGKRLFKMAPIHHHFELIGWHETKVVVVFTVTTVLLCLLSFAIVL